MTPRTFAATALACAAAVSLSGCASFDPAKLATTINDQDKGCYKNIHVTVTPMMLFGWYVPIVSGSFDKVCNAEKGGPAPLTVGAIAVPAAPIAALAPPAASKTAP